MSLREQSSKQTLLKALHWLDKQPDNWAEHIKDSQVAVKMYLKSQNKEEKTSSLVKQFSPFIKKEQASQAFEKDLDPKVDFEKKEKQTKLRLSEDSKSSPPADWSDLLPKKKEELVFPSGKSLCLDKLSQEALEQTKKALNLQREEDVLRLLIQLGQKSLQKILA